MRVRTQPHDAEAAAGVTRHAATQRGTDRATGVASPLDASPRMVAQRKMLSAIFGPAVVQRMRVQDGMEISSGAAYLILTDQREHLHVRPKAAPPQPGALFEAQGVRELADPAVAPGAHEDAPQTIKYSTYRAKQQFISSELRPNDCGTYARALAMGSDTWSKDRNLAVGPSSVPPRPSRHEGLQPKSQYDPNPGWDNPDSRDIDLGVQVGEVLEINWDDPVPDEAPAKHHVATAIATDGADYVTNEADCTLNLKRGQFRMYGADEDTFWDAHHTSFENENIDERRDGKGQAVVTKRVKTPVGSTSKGK